MVTAFAVTLKASLKSPERIISLEERRILADVDYFQDISKKISVLDSVACLGVLKKS